VLHEIRQTFWRNVEFNVDVAFSCFITGPPVTAMTHEESRCNEGEAGEGAYMAICATGLAAPYALQMAAFLVSHVF
jgi:hypothetical protein